MTYKPVDIDSRWLRRFHQGDRRVIEAIYAAHYPAVAAAVGSILQGADREGAIHDIFLRLLESEATRRCFQGGSMGAWLKKMARNRAVDIYRRRQRLTELDAQSLGRSTRAGDSLAAVEARGEVAWLSRVIERFKHEVLPKIEI